MITYFSVPFQKEYIFSLIFAAQSTEGRNFLLISESCPLLIIFGILSLLCFVRSLLHFLFSLIISPLLE